MRRRSPTRVTRLSSVPFVVPAATTRSNLSSGRTPRGWRGRRRRRPIRALPSDPVRNERPAHASGTQHPGNHRPGNDLPQPLIHRPPLPLRSEQQGVPQPPTPHRHRFQQLAVIVLCCHGRSLPLAECACVTSEIRPASRAGADAWASSLIRPQWEIQRRRQDR